DIYLFYPIRGVTRADLVLVAQADENRCVIIKIQEKLLRLNQPEADALCIEVSEELSLSLPQQT
ncbi:hypothetical protein P9B04_22090, partial [Crocosphaera sp. Alani8]